MGLMGLFSDISQGSFSSQRLSRQRDLRALGAIVDIPVNIQAGSLGGVLQMIVSGERITQAVRSAQSYTPKRGSTAAKQTASKVG